MYRLLLPFVVFMLLANGLFAQQMVKVSGVIYDQDNKPLAKVNVGLVGLAAKTISDEKGYYEISSRLSNFSISYKLIGHKTEILKFSAEKGSQIQRNVVLLPDVKELKNVEVFQKDNSLRNARKIELGAMANMPLASLNFESVLKTLPGVSTNNELSSQYSVRGGNFDENLIYVNDVEINRPILVRNGQQEGLSFINPDLVSKASFFAGGFGAKYDDRLSSVLDVRYDRPDSNSILLGLGLLGQSLSIKQKTDKSYWLFGFRHKNNKNLLSTQDQLGAYSPNFFDIQTLYHQQFSERFSLNLMANFNTGRFRLVPESRETLFGTLDKPMRLKIDYEGQEIDDYQNQGAALTLNYSPNGNMAVKWINSYFGFIERERFDIDGAYVFEEIDQSETQANFGPIRKNRGLGSYYSYARNKLNTDLLSSAIKIQHQLNGHHNLSYGLRFENARYSDKLNEYSYIDSAGYVLPINTQSYTFQNLIFSNNKLSTNNLSAYLQDDITISSKTSLQLGLRWSKTSLSTEHLLSPRLMMAFRPSAKEEWRFAAGIYYQQPSYRSLRDVAGHLLLTQKAQRSYNLSTAYDFSFIGLGTVLKFTSELYYKYADRLIPYTIDNVRVKYMPNHLANGHTLGADFSVGGELVKDLMSYFRISLLKANQDIYNDSYLKKDANGNTSLVYPGYLKRPTDQRLNVSLFFQDRLFRSPTYKVHLNMLYGSRLPIGSPYSNTYSDDFSIPSYRRVDIGFSTDFLDPQQKKRWSFLSKNFDSVIAYAEIFNLFNINNTVSYLWLKDVDNVSYAIPNYLTARQLNVKLVLKLKN